MANRIPTAALVPFCQMVRVGLESGLPIKRIFEQQSERGPLGVRPLARRIAEQLAEGESLTEAVRAEGSALPSLVLSLVEVGEQTGSLSASFRELEEYFELQLSLRRTFRTQIIWPVAQFVIAVCTICIMLWILGAINAPIDPLGLGVGGWAAMKFLLIVGSVVGIIYALYLAISKQLRFQAPVERFIMKLPVVGPALESVLLGRFTTGLRFTLGAGLSVPDAVRYSLNATSSALYQQSYQKAEPGLKRGEELTEVLQRCGVFPPDFIDIVANAEETGQVPEVMVRVSRSYHEEAERRLKALARLAAGLVYLVVAIMIIYLIFKLYSFYIAQLRF